MANIRHHLIIRASVQQVYAAITSEEGLRGWWTNETTAKAEEGYTIHFKFGEEYFNKMKITKLIANSEVHWECVDGDKEWITTKLSFTLEETGDTTLLKFAHLNWAEESEFFGFCCYQWGRYLESLKLLCETGKGKPFIK